VYTALLNIVYSEENDELVEECSRRSQLVHDSIRHYWELLDSWLLDFWDFDGVESQRSRSNADNVELTKRLNAAIADREGQLQHHIGMASIMPAIIDSLMIRIVRIETHAPEYEQVRRYLQELFQQRDGISEKVPALAAELDGLKMCESNCAQPNPREAEWLSCCFVNTKRSDGRHKARLLDLFPICLAYTKDLCRMRS
jgi:hypothetical protein